MASLAILAASYYYYESQREFTEGYIRDQLILAAEAKARQVAAWRDERMGVARTILADQLTLGGLRRVITRKASDSERARISILCHAWLDHLRFSGLLLTDANGAPVMQAGRTLASEAHLGAFAERAMTSTEVTFIDMHSDGGNPAHFGFALPLRAASGEAAYGALLLIADPRNSIDPIMSAWPLPGNSGETLLVRRDGDHVLFLNELRYRRGADGRLHVPLSQTETPAVQAVLGHGDVHGGIDYRGVAVLSTSRQVPGTSWHVVAKQDRDEAYAPIRRRAAQLAVTALALWLAVGMALLLAWRHRDARERARRYMEEVEHQALRGHYDLLSRYANDVILLMDEGGRIVEANERASAVYGYSRDELLRLTVLDLRPPSTRADVKEHWDAAMTRGSLLFETVHQRKDGRGVPMEISVRRVSTGGQMYLQSIIRDISERRQAEEEQHKLREQLAQSQKMESIGRLAGGVAHDFNNHLTVINGYCEMLLADAGPVDPRREHLQEILRAGQMAANLTRQLLVFGRKSIVEPKPVNLNAVIADTRRMLERVLGEDIGLVSLPGADLPEITADLSQLNQVLMNLAVNAREAMPDGGKIIVETSRIDLDEDYASMHSGVTPGAYVLLAFSDTGDGMTPEVQRQIFEPFYTTKGHGTGLGLSTVYGIVRQCLGHIWVYSEPGKGTTFKLYFPALLGARPTTTPELPASAWTPGGTVLVVEDQESVRRVEVETLRRHGFDVVEADSAEAALQQMSDTPLSLRLLVTDVVLPGMTGRDLANRLIELQPGLKVLYTSGYTENVIAHRGMLDPGVLYLPKPLTPESLTSKLKEIL